ncbi:hypothetical protein AG1IA_08935 [Rhizoctonia solani AG-1 IA]|uniref:Uncharacterized protein n=1 Tax=Thanatephorus cucumeris (strain AG1-IA) TaxID=983506 RepID=L8WGE2_THACA|nr:hypothetical protein AG1IA_08935 [Rhizoctonia solani AG-1 IA]
MLIVIFVPSSFPPSLRTISHSPPSLTAGRDGHPIHESCSHLSAPGSYRRHTPDGPPLVAPDGHDLSMQLSYRGCISEPAETHEPRLKRRIAYDLPSQSRGALKAATPHYRPYGLYPELGLKPPVRRLATPFLTLTVLLFDGSAVFCERFALFAFSHVIVGCAQSTSTGPRKSRERSGTRYCLRAFRSVWYDARKCSWSAPKCSPSNPDPSDPNENRSTPERSRVFGAPVETILPQRIRSPSRFLFSYFSDSQSHSLAFTLCIANLYSCWEFLIASAPQPCATIVRLGHPPTNSARVSVPQPSSAYSVPDPPPCCHQSPSFTYTHHIISFNAIVAVTHAGVQVCFGQVPIELQGKHRFIDLASSRGVL